MQIGQGIVSGSREAAGRQPPGRFVDTLADNIVKLSLTAMEAFLNGVVQDLARPVCPAGDGYSGWHGPRDDGPL